MHLPLLPLANFGNLFGVDGLIILAIGLLGMAGVRAIWAFAGIYLLAVNMRILGLLYLINQRKLFQNFFLPIIYF